MKENKIFFSDQRTQKLFDSMSEKDPIKKGLLKAIKDIKADFQIGRLITKNTHNKGNIKFLLKKYKVDNIRVYNLPSAWRMLYSITAKGNIEIIAVILDWMTHKEYERLLK